MSLMAEFWDRVDRNREQFVLLTYLGDTWRCEFVSALAYLMARTPDRCRVAGPVQSPTYPGVNFHLIYAYGTQAEIKIAPVEFVNRLMTAVREKARSAADDNL